MYGTWGHSNPRPTERVIVTPLTGDEQVGDTSLTASIGLIHLGQYLAKHAAFTAYLKEKGQS
jgi:hypothetical protein